MSNFRTIDRDTGFLLPPSMDEPAPAVLAELRNAALTVIRKLGQKPRPAREAFAEQKWRAIRLVMTS